MKMAASYLDKAQVNTAITENTKLDLGHTHVTTADFMQFNVAMCHEMVPGSKIDVSMESLARLNPMPVPSFGRASIRNRAFFVPFRTIFRGWNDFITDSVHVASDGYNAQVPAGVLGSVPTVSSTALLAAFTNSVGGTATSDHLLWQSASWLPTYTSDIVVSGTKYDFTVIGRQAIKLLESLGYKLDVTPSKAVNFSALPLLAMAKIFTDWYWPQQYTNVAEYDGILAMCNLDVNAGPQQLTSSQVQAILKICTYVMYDSDYFVSAWDQPNSPNAGNYSTDFKLVNIDTIHDITGLWNGTTNSFAYTESGYVSNNSGSSTISNRVGGADAPFITPTIGAVRSDGNNYGAPTPISQYLLHSLHALSDYLQRNRLAGSKAAERYLARFGKALPAEKLNRSLYLGSSMQDIQIGDVMSHTNSYNDNDEIGTRLGGYAGKGLSYGNGHFSCDTDEFGYFMIISSIVPAVGYFQGIDRMVMRTNKLDFYTPEFDSLGVQPITAAELYMPQYSGQMLSGDAYEQIFGFTPRYADYKQATTMNRVTGNFRLLSINAFDNEQRFNAADSWYLDRVFNNAADFNFNYANVVHSPDFISGKMDFTQYHRLFYSSLPETPDNFTIIHNFEIAEQFPGKALWDSYEFEDKGKKVTVEANGVKLN